MAETLPSRSEIEAALARVREWPGLARSPQLAKFLNYIVEAKLNGNEAGIKAYAIAVDVFGRPQSFDPQSDPIVRVQARRLRAALEEYYATEGAGETVRFYLPVGRYIPEFVGPEDRVAPAVGESLPAAPLMGRDAKREEAKPLLAQIEDIVLVVLLVAVALGVALALTQVLAPRPVRKGVPQPPQVAVAEFTSVAAGGQPAVSVAGLAVELVTDLDLFPYIEATYLPRLDIAGPGASAPYELTGIARTEGSDVQITASLKRAGSDTAVWSMTQSVPIESVAGSLDRLSQAFADQLGAVGGPLHAEAIAWLQANPDLSGSETEYLCSLLFSLYRDHGGDAAYDRARTCVSGLLRLQPQSAAALSMSASLLLDATFRIQPPDRPDPEPIAQAGRQLTAALRAAPTSSQVWREYAFYLDEVGRFGEAEAAFISALQLNPADLDALAGYGRMLSLNGESERGERLAEEALRRSIAPPYWYHEATAVNALRSGDNARALAEAELLTVGDAELGSVIAAVAAHRVNSVDVLNRSIAQLLEVTRFRRFGILPVLRQRLGDAELVSQIGKELAAAGIDQAALNGPY
ncbi:hypothetical protein PRN20_17440 [Devosia sp. ZB163]|uniref:tetratricopeptide repeat protein n=1 Tax=Devosia sp. ZB163 TaxID=3025938 RepID=UPI00235FEBD5|nr:hypothetical protein [Devosia sp. ZB163]MDC9825519.1 hypothetical protein [Devosia sp. ZB163]